MPVSVVCKECGDHYKVKPCKVGKTSFCSMKCKSSWQRKNLRGITNPYKGKPLYSDEELLQHLKNLSYELGRTPTSKQMKNKKGYPSPGTFFVRFGSWKKACQLAGLVPNKGMYGDCYVIHNNIKYASFLEVEIVQILDSNNIVYKYNVPIVIDGRNFSADFQIKETIIEADGITKRNRPLNANHPKIKYYLEEKIPHFVVKNIEEAKTAIEKITGKRILISPRLDHANYRILPEIFAENNIKYLHHNLHMSITAIAKKLNCSPSAITAYMEKHQIPLYKYVEIAEKKANPSLISHLYFNEHKSIQKIAEALSLSGSYVHKIMVTNNMPRRPRIKQR